jgi:hypothetical protein
VFTITLSKAGESSIVYNVTVNVAMSPMVFVLTTPTPGALNTLTGGGADTDVVVHVVNGITSVVITGTKTAGQTVSKSGTDSAYVSIGGTATAPTFTVNTSSIAAAGGTRTFKLTLNEVGKGTIVYDVTVTVAGYTDQMTLSLTTPSPGGGNTINVTGTGGARAVAVSVINGTGTVELTGGKTVAQDTSKGGTNAGDVTVGGSGTAPTFTIDTDSIKAAGGSKTFTITLSETGKGSIVYTVTVTVAAP